MKSLPAFSQFAIVFSFIFAFGIGKLPNSAKATSARVSFGGNVPCNFAKQRCNKDSQTRYVFSDVAGVEYRVTNTGRGAMTIRPSVIGYEGREVSHPSRRTLKPGETGWFVVYLPVRTPGAKTFDICAVGSNGPVTACRQYSVFVVE